MSVTLSIIAALWLLAAAAVTVSAVVFYSNLSRKFDSLNAKTDSLLTLAKSVLVYTGWIKQKYSALQTFMQDTASAVNKLTISSESDLSRSNETFAFVKEILAGVQVTSTLVKDTSKEIAVEIETIRKSLERIESLVSSVPAFYDETGRPVDSIVFSQGESSRKAAAVGAAAATPQDSGR